MPINWRFLEPDRTRKALSKPPSDERRSRSNYQLTGMMRQSSKRLVRDLALPRAGDNVITRMSTSQETGKIGEVVVDDASESSVGTGVGDSVCGNVAVLVSMKVAVGVGVAVGSAVSVGVAVSIDVTVDVAVSVGVPVTIGTVVRVGAGVLVVVGVAVSV